MDLALGIDERVRESYVHLKRLLWNFKEWGNWEKIIYICKALTKKEQQKVFPLMLPPDFNGYK